MEYCKSNNIDVKDIKLAVIMQEMVIGEKSGIAFSIDPVGGVDKNVIIEATIGLGDKVTSGTITPDCYSYNWYEEKILKQTGNVLSTKEVLQLSNLVIDIQVKLGYPVDIEWTIKNNIIYILQVRPITKIQYKDIKGEWTTANYKDGGVARTVCYPLMWSIYDLAWEGLSYEYIRKLGLVGKNNIPLYADMFYGRPYWNVGEFKTSFLKMPGFVEKDYDEQLGLEKTYEGKGRISKITLLKLPKAMKAVVTLGILFKKQEEFGAVFKEKQYKRLKELSSINPNTYKSEDLFKIWKDFIQKEYYQNEYSYFWHIYILTVYQSVFFGNLSKYATTSEILNLVVGLKDISHLMPSFELWDISREIKKNNDESDFMNKGYLDEFISKYKHLSTHELDISVPRYDEDLNPVIEIVNMYLGLDDTYNPRIGEEKQSKISEEQYNKIINKIPNNKKNGIKKQIETMRTFLWWREELRDLSIRYYYFVRKFTVALARDFNNNGVIDSVDDIHYLRLNDILDFFDGKKTKEDMKTIIIKNKKYYESFRNFKNKNEIGNIYLNSKVKYKKDNTLVGIACSQGKVSGTARIIEDIKDITKIQKGDILVVKYLDPAWTSKYGIIKGIVSEGGGILSHAAVIAREYGIPAVMGVRDATAIINNGKEITIDGNGGKVICS